jgi:hypothetical protein
MVKPGERADAELAMREVLAAKFRTFSSLIHPPHRHSLSAGGKSKMQTSKRVNSVAGEQLTRRMISILLAHAPGERPVRIDEVDTLRALKARGLIRYNRLNRPSQSIATARGREVIKELLSRPQLSPSDPDLSVVVLPP